MSGWYRGVDARGKGGGVAGEYVQARAWRFAWVAACAEKYAKVVTCVVLGACTVCTVGCGTRKTCSNCAIKWQPFPTHIRHLLTSPLTHSPSLQCSVLNWLRTHTHTQIMSTCLTAVHPCARLCLPVPPVPRPLAPPSPTMLQHFGLLKLAINALKHKWIYTHAACCCNPFPFPFPCCMQETRQHAISLPSPCHCNTPSPPLLGICAAIPFVVEAQWGGKVCRVSRLLLENETGLKPMEMEQLQCQIDWNKWNGTEFCIKIKVGNGMKYWNWRELYENEIVSRMRNVWNETENLQLKNKYENETEKDFKQFTFFYLFIFFVI